MGLVHRAVVRRLVGRLAAGRSDSMADEQVNHSPHAFVVTLSCQSLKILLELI